MTKASHTTRDPKLPIASSQNLGWESILIEEFQQPPGGIEHFALPEHSIAVCLATKPNRLSWKIMREAKPHRIFSAASSHGRSPLCGTLY